MVLLSGLLAGWMMGVLSWLISGGRDSISQVFFTWLVTAAIGLGYLHHAITGTVEVLAGVLSGPTVSLGGFAHFLAWTTADNAIGGILFALSVRFSLRIRDREDTASTEK